MPGSFALFKRRAEKQKKPFIEYIWLTVDNFFLIQVNIKVIYDVNHSFSSSSYYYE